ncbi:hypothetical protein WN944_026631 [Citrus x changshan-huyou]|uniref:Rad60/SUMO-like domain-containing protein n=3 Tax=Citrus TaxID=2706 RepID=V4RJE7_CITCL|nr:hypothetical protein CICLE_v10006329mg [Citrus x clementina]GAY61636.1 hypothetical protein CUMW_211550 [Citrus unshiu]
MEKSPDNIPDQHFINLVVKGQDNDPLYFEFRRDWEIKKLLITYCEKKDAQYGTFPFLINGNRFPHIRTPDQLGLKDGDEIIATFYAGGA